MNDIVPLGFEFYINSTNFNDTQRTQAMVATTDGGIMVVWQSKHADGSTYDILGQKFGADGLPTGAEIVINTGLIGDQENVAIAATPNGFVVTWQGFQTGDHDIYARQYTNTLTPLAEVKLNTTTTGTQWQPDIAHNGSSYAVWYDEGKVMLGGITGSSAFSNVVVATGVGTNANATITALDGQPGKFVIAYATGSGNLATIFDSGNATFSAPFALSSGTFSIVSLAGGQFLVLSNGTEITAQIYSATGAAIGGSIDINTTTDGPQGAAQAVALSGGGFFVVWHSDAADTGDFEVLGQRFTDTGRPLGGEIVINDTTTGFQGTPQIVELVTGELVITYRSNDTDGGDILARVFNVPIANLDQIITGDGVDNELIGDTGFDVIEGFGGNDTLNGKTGDDTLDGGNGNDILIGERGEDFMTGGIGDDSLSGGANRDKLYGGRGKDLLEGDRGRDVLDGGRGSDSLYGGDSKDALYGGDDNDLLDGGDGRDKLFGNAGDDTLIGGADADQFVFKTGDGSDRITDFTDGEDRIRIVNGADEFADLTILDLGADALVVFSDVVIRLENVDHADLTAADFIF